jgi:hypothetical protein
VNLKPLNKFMSRKRFKEPSGSPEKGRLEDFHRLEGCVPSSPHTQAAQEASSLSLEKKLYEFQCLPFGLSSAPRILTKILKPFMAALRAGAGNQVIIYIDNILLIASRPSQASGNQPSQMPGFCDNLEKSSLIPQQIILYLGFLVNSISMTRRTNCTGYNGTVSKTVRQLARLTSRMVATAQAILPAPLYCRSLQHLKIQCFRDHSPSRLSAEARQELIWWSEQVWRSISLGEPNLVKETDASLLGWGAHMEGRTTGGMWSIHATSISWNSWEVPLRSEELYRLPHEIEDGKSQSCVLYQPPRRHEITNPNRIS